jgi:hypothetical protein
MFLKFVDASLHLKDANMIYSMLVEVVEEFGVKHVVQVITENATNYVVVSIKLCDKYPTIFWTSCVAHCIDLILVDI